MKIASVRATWVHVPIRYASQHVSDFGRGASFDSVIVKIERIALVPQLAQVARILAEQQRA